MHGNMFLAFDEGQGEVKRMLVGVGGIAARSFDSHPMRVKTKAAVDERVSFCIRMAVELRNDQKWSLARILDELPRALAAKLDGRPWVPADRQTWVAPDRNA